MAAGVVYGTARDSRSVVLPNATVNAYKASRVTSLGSGGPSSPPTGGADATATAAATGAYTITLPTTNEPYWLQYVSATDPSQTAWQHVFQFTGGSGYISPGTFVSGIVATTSPGTPLPNDAICRVTTTPSSGQVVLPTAAPGMVLTVLNAGANTLTVVANGADTITGTATILTGKASQFLCAVAGQWNALVGG